MHPQDIHARQAREGSIRLPRVGSTLARNSLLNAGARGVVMLFGLLTTPIVFSRLDPGSYGVYILALSLGSMVGILDFGLTPALVMLLSRAWRQGDRDKMQRDVSSAFLLFVAVGVGAGGVLMVLVPWLVSGLLHVPFPDHQAATAALRFSIAAFALNMWLAVFEAVPIALERYDLVAGRMVVLSIVNTGAVILCALAGGGIQALMLVNLATTAAGLALFYFVSRSLLPFLRFRPGFDRRSVRELVRFGSFKFAGSVGGTLAYRFDQFAIAGILGVQAVGFYSIPSSASSRISSSLLQLVTPLFPRVSKLKGDEVAVRELFLDGTRIMMVVTVPVLLCLFVYGDIILRYWIGGTRGHLVALHSTAALRWLLLAFLIQSLAAVPGIFAEGLGRPEVNNGFSVLGAVIHVPLVLYLVPTFGITGAALALFLNSATQTLAFIAFASWKLVRVPAREFFGFCAARPLLPAIPAGAVGYAARPLIHGIPTLVCGTFAVTIVYVIIARIGSVITPFDLVRVKAALPGELVVVVDRAWRRKGKYGPRIG